MKKKTHIFWKILYSSVIFKSTEKRCSLNSVLFFVVFVNLDPQVHVTSNSWCSKKSAQLQWGKNDQKLYFMSQNENLCLHAEFENKEFVCAYPSRKKHHFFKCLCDWFLGQTSTSCGVFSKGEKIWIFQMTIFPLRDHIRKKNIKLHENSFLSEVGGGVQMKKNVFRLSQWDSETPNMESRGYIRFEKS